MIEPNDDAWGLVLPFWIDTDGYSDRDRNMFVCGFEFCMIADDLKDGWSGCRPIHRENESRVRLLCAHVGVACEIRQHTGYDGCETWSDLLIGDTENAMP